MPRETTLEAPRTRGSVLVANHTRLAPADVVLDVLARIQPATVEGIAAVTGEAPRACLRTLNALLARDVVARSVQSDPADDRFTLAAVWSVG